MNDPIDPHTEDQLRRALGERAQETTASPDALDQIRNRRPTNAWSRPAVYAGVAAVLALLVGIAVWNLPNDDADPADVAEDPAPTTTVAASTTSAVPNTTTTTVAIEPNGPAATPWQFTEILPAGPDRYAEQGAILWPTDDRTFATGEDAARSWAEEVLGLRDAMISPDQIAIGGTRIGAHIGVFGVHGINENGDPSDLLATRILVTSIDDGTTWVVTHAASDEFQVSLVEENTPGTIRVTGTGVAFEGTATIQVGDAEPALLQVGGVEPAAFSVVLPAPASYPVPIIIRSGTVLENEIPQTHAFAAVPAERTTDIVVFGVAADDVLNVRSGAGVANGIVGTLAPDATGIAHTGGEELVGTDTWWEVTHGSSTGWVNRQFVSVQPFSGFVTVDVANNPIRLLVGENPGENIAGYAEAVWIGGIGVYADAPTSWTAVRRQDLGSVQVDFCPDGIDRFREDCELTVPEFLGVESAKWDLAIEEASPEIAPTNWGTTSGLPPEFYDQLLTSTIFIPEPDPDNSLDWRRYTIVWGADNGALRVEGMWRWGWTP